MQERHPSISNNDHEHSMLYLVSMLACRGLGRGRIHWDPLLATYLSRAAWSDKERHVTVRLMQQWIRWRTMAAPCRGGRSGLGEGREGE
jgi:hypothetical protein